MSINRSEIIKPLQLRELQNLLPMFKLIFLQIQQPQ